MKTTLLSLILFIFLLAGYSQSKYTTLSGPNKDLLLKPVDLHPDVNNPVFGGVPGAKLYDFTQIGTTWNDLQVLNYGNAMQRMWVYPDGTIASTWTCEGQDAIPDRGSGYNYFDGNDWQEPTLHVGPDERMGNPCYAPWGPEGEIISIYRYVAGEGPMYFFKREVKGEGDWEQVILDPPSDCSIVWQAMVTSGENNEHIHMLAYTYDAEFQGQANALVYYRSSDGGETWDIAEEVIDGLGSDYYPTISSMSYTFSNPVGNTLAFTYGFDEFGGKLFKTYDNGDTWEMIDVFTTPFDPLDAPDASDNFGCGVGSSAVVLDSEGKAHVAFPRMVRVFVDGAANYFPYTDGMIYWNEDMEPLDTATISATTMEYLEEGGNLIGWILGDETYEIPADQPNYANALCGFPQMSIDANDNIFVAYSSVAPGYSNGLVDYRHIIVNASFDGGMTWEGQEDLNTELIFIFSECAFPTLPPVTDDNFHVTYQEDSEPGINGWLANHDPVENHMHYMEIEKGAFVGLFETTAQQSFTLSECYPNPASSNTMIQVGLQEDARVNIQVINVVGQLVRTLPALDLTTGNHPVSIDVSDLSPGLYYCTVESGQQKITRKFVVRK